MTKRQLLTMNEACRYLGISRGTLLKSEEEELIAPVRTVGGHRRYSTGSLNHLIRTTTGSRTSPGSSAWVNQGYVALPKIIERLAQRSPSPEDTIKEVLRDSIKFLQADAGFIALLDGRNTLWPQVAVGVSVPFEIASASIPLQATVSGRVLQLQHPLAYDGSEDDIPFEGITQGICAPLIYQGAPLGVVHVFSVTRRQFLPAELGFLSLVALYLSGLMANRKLAAEARRREEELSCLNRISQTLQKQRGLDGMAHVLLSAAISTVKADAGILFLQDERGDISISSVQGVPEGVNETAGREFKALAARLLDSKEPYLTLASDQVAAPGADLRPVLYGIKSAVLIALRSDGENLGAIEMCSRSPRKVADWQMPFLHLLCAQAAVTMQQAILHERLAQKREEERSLRDWYEKTIARNSGRAP